MNQHPHVDRWGAVTHRVSNVPPPLVDYDLYTTDAALTDAVHTYAGTRHDVALSQFATMAGAAEYLELGFEANANPPRFEPHDRRGERVDLVRFHPSYHALMTTSLEHGLHASHWDPDAQESGHAHLLRAARYLVQSQVEAGHLCPVTMTSAALPTLRHSPDLFAAWAPRITARGYDPRNVPAQEKSAVTIGMAMTEKQGGSDVRANTTHAVPLDRHAPASWHTPGPAYELVGHKYFVSAPMCDAFLVLAQAPGGLSCFLLPRWRPDGTKNPLQVQRLKPKMGNVSNASTETELRGALAWRVGAEGRGVRTIIEMVAMTRLDCMLGSAAGMRQAVAQAAHHCSHRSAFGALLAVQPLMQNVLADLAVESEAATAFAMRIATALDRRSDPGEDLLVRIGTAVGKYWICKRTPGHAYEAMECIGGSAMMEDHLMPRLFRESPINAIWEGSGNVQCLDLLRAMRTTPEAVAAFLEEVQTTRGADARLDRHVDALRAALEDGDRLEYRARDVLARMAIAIQGSLLIRHGDPTVTEVFLASRTARPDDDWAGSGRLYGSLPAGLDLSAVVKRATPTG